MHKTWLPLWLLLFVTSPAQANAPSFKIPGDITFDDQPQRADDEVYLGHALGVDRRGDDGFFIIHVPSFNAGLSRKGHSACAHKRDLKRLPIRPYGAPDAINEPVISADSPTVYADLRYYQGSSYNRDGFFVHRLRCDDLALREPSSGAILPTQLRLTYDPQFTTFEPVGPLLAWEERLCVASADAIGCAWLSEQTPTLRTLTTPLEVMLQLAPAPTYEDEQAWRAAMDAVRYTFGASVALPDGRMAALLRGDSPDERLPGRLGVADFYLVLLRADGRLDRVLYSSPARWHGERTERVGLALGAARGLVYHPERDALIVWPVDDHDWTMQRAILSGGGVSQVTRGFSGTGLLFIPLSEPGVGYLPLSAALVETADYERAGGAGSGLGVVNSIPNITQLRLLGPTQAVLGITRPIKNPLLRWDEDTLDLDQDGLNAAQEARLGTSDWRWDSDGDGIADGVEVASDLDPTRDEGKNGPIIFEQGEIALAQSSWLKTWRLPELAQSFRGQRQIAANPGVMGPLCVDQRCVWPDGHALHVPHDIAAISLDGRLASSRDGSQRTDLITGQTTPWLKALPSGHYALAWYVEDAKSAYYVDDVGRVWHIDASGQPRQVFDVASYRDPRPGSEYPIAHRGPQFATPIGYHQQTGRVLMGLIGGWDAWIIGVKADSPLRIFENAQSMTRLNRHSLSAGGGDPFPKRLHPNGHGDYIADDWVYGPYLTNGRMGGFLSYLGAESLADQTLTGGWGDVLIDAGTGQELVTILRVVEPGDVLLARDGMLYRVGPRGGLASLWPAPRQDVPMRRFALSPGGRACFVAHEPQGRWLQGTFVELSPGEDGRVPEVRTALVEGHPFLDCAYEDEDTVRLLVRAPLDAQGSPTVQIMRWRRGQAQLEPVGEPMQAHEYEGFYDQPRGVSATYKPFHVQDADQNKLEFRLDDGRAIRLHQTVRDDDALSRRLKAHFGSPALAILDGAARADGILILSTTKGLVAWHSELDSFAPVITYGGDLSGALARVPGGVARDPWTRRPIAADLIRPATSPQDPLSPLGPPPPSLGGDPTLEPTPGADPSCAGCASAAGPRSPLAAPLLLLLLLLAIGRCRRRLTTLRRHA